jgi:hypothetical protein
MEIPRLPLVPRLINLVGSGLAKAGLEPGGFDLDRLLARARRRAGLPDGALGDGAEAFERLVRSLHEDAALSTLGRFIAAGDLERVIANALRLDDWHARHPEIGRESVTRPIFIVGQGRTGTTILHELLMLDPANRIPLTWEADDPFPPPERASYRSDPRIAAAQQQIDRSESLIPDFKRIHRMGAELPQECVRLAASTGRSLIFPAQFRVTSYTEWLLDEAALAPAYRTHRRFLQLLQWRCPAERWVLKSPAHLWCLDALLDEYPDACLIQTHRDPIAILSSLTSLECVLRKMCSDAIVPREIAQEWSGWLVRAYQRSVEFRERGRLPASRIVDLHFDRFMRDPIANVREIYRHFELELRPEVEAAMRRYIESNPSDRDGRHRHRFEDTGLDLEQERAAVRRYTDYFDVTAEKRA